MQKTNYPIPFETLQMVMNDLGYGLDHHDPDPEKPILHWRKSRKPNAELKGYEGLPEWVTTLKPDFTASGHDSPVYDRDYVVDLITVITGESDGQAGCRLWLFLRRKR
jgi:hypothetical protein